MNRDPIDAQTANALLAKLEAEYGDGVLAALLAAGLNSDVQQAIADEPNREDVFFDYGWLEAFVDHPAFQAALSEDAAPFFE